MSAEVLGSFIDISDLPRNTEKLDEKFVPLCITQSAPHLNGYCKGGGPKVESTRRWPFTAWTLKSHLDDELIVAWSVQSPCPRNIEYFYELNQFSFMKTSALNLPGLSGRV